MSNLNAHQLNIFLEAADTLNFTQAAERLHISQPSVSQNVQALEEHFGLALFLRSGRNIELSDAGIALVPLVRELVVLAKHIEETMASIKGGIQGHLSVGCSTSTGRYILPKLLAYFHTQFPQVRATCHVLSQEDSLNMLLEGKVHLAMASDPPYIADIEFRHLLSESIILIVPRQHPWTGLKEIDLDQLFEGDFILPTEGSETYNCLREVLAQQQRSIYKLNSIMTLGSPEAIALSVEEGLGVGFVPNLLVNRLVPERVNQVHVRGLSLQRNIYIGRMTRRPATAAQEAFWEFVTANDSLFKAWELPETVDLPRTKPKAVVEPRSVPGPAH